MCIMELVVLRVLLVLDIVTVKLEEKLNGDQ